jgi:low temperature requirement protein LtrA
VFTITQLTTLLVHEPTWQGLGRVTLLLGLIFWMYGGYAWLTNSVALDRLIRRLILLCGMAGFLVVALAIPDAFHGSGTTFGLAYMGVVAIHFGMFVKSSQLSVVQAIRGLAPFNLTTALLVLLGGMIGGTAQYVLWIVAFAGEWLSPWLVDNSGFVIQPGHFVERHGLVVLIAIGESVVAVGIAAAGYPIDSGLITIALLGLALSASLWWVHFGGDEPAAERAMEATSIEQRPDVAIRAFGYCHLLLLLGVLAIAMGLKKATGQPFDGLPVAESLALGGGTGLFLLGEGLFRRALAFQTGMGHEVVALLVLATIPVGHLLGPVAQLALIVAVVVALLVVSRADRPADRR